MLSLLVIYTTCWWLILFMTLPIAVKMEETPTAGHATSAPKKTYLKQKLLATSLLAAIATFLIHLLMNSETLSAWLALR